VYEFRLERGIDVEGTRERPPEGSDLPNAGAKQHDGELERP
jgi:hypothetical protein